MGALLINEELILFPLYKLHSYFISTFIYIYILSRSIFKLDLLSQKRKKMILISYLQQHWAARKGDTGIADFGEFHEDRKQMEREEQRNKSRENHNGI